MQSKQTSNLKAEGNSQPKENHTQHSGIRKKKKTCTKEAEANPNPWNMLHSIVTWRQEQSWIFKVQPYNLNHI